MGPAKATLPPEGTLPNCVTERKSNRIAGQAHHGLMTPTAPRLVRLGSREFIRQVKLVSSEPHERNTARNYENLGRTSCIDHDGRAGEFEDCDLDNDGRKSEYEPGVLDIDGDGRAGEQEPHSIFSIHSGDADGDLRFCEEESPGEDLDGDGTIGENEPQFEDLNGDGDMVDAPDADDDGDGILDEFDAEPVYSRREFESCPASELRFDDLSRRGASLSGANGRRSARTP